jgi:hypothetical protein
MVVALLFYLYDANAGDRWHVFFVAVGEKILWSSKK